MNKIENVYYFFSNDKFSPYIFFESIFLKTNTEDFKDNSKEVANTPIKISLETPQISTYKHKSKQYECTYSIKKMNAKKTVYKVGIEFYYEVNKEIAAVAFSHLIQNIKIEKKNQFNMVSIKDSLSIYFSQRLYPILAVYERSLRALILAIFVPIYEISWHSQLNNSVGKDFFPKLGTKDKLEKALEELDLIHLERIFFESHSAINHENYSSLFDTENLNNLTKEELIDSIRNNQPLSLWEKQINKYVDIENPKEKMSIIRYLRNRIAHNKSFTHKNYNVLTQELDYMINKISEATEKILQEHNQNTSLETVALISESFKEIIINLDGNISESIRNISRAIMNESTLESIRNMARSTTYALSSMQPSLPTQELANTIMEISKSIQNNHLTNLPIIQPSVLLYDRQQEDEIINDIEDDNED